MSERFENELKKMLERGADGIDQSTRDELASRRRAVLDAEGRGRRPGWYWLPAGAAAAALVAVMLVQLPGNQALPVAAGTELDLEILLAEENLDLYEDLEFYEWLEVTGDAG